MSQNYAQKTSKDMRKIRNYEGALESQYIHDERQNSYFDYLFQRITICLIQGINFIAIKVL